LGDAGPALLERAVIDGQLEVLPADDLRFAGVDVLAVAAVKGAPAWPVAVWVPTGFWA
jgi:hypothetical protein